MKAQNLTSIQREIDEQIRIAREEDAKREVLEIKHRCVRIARQIAIELGVDWEAVTMRNQVGKVYRGDFTNQRAIIYRRMRELNYSLLEIADAFGQSHSTVLKALNKQKKHG